MSHLNDIKTEIKLIAKDYSCKVKFFTGIQKLYVVTIRKKCAIVTIIKLDKDDELAQNRNLLIGNYERSVSSHCKKVNKDAND